MADPSSRGLASTGPRSRLATVGTKDRAAVTRCSSPMTGGLRYGSPLLPRRRAEACSPPRVDDERLRSRARPSRPGHGSSRASGRLFRPSFHNLQHRCDTDEYRSDSISSTRRRDLGRSHCRSTISGGRWRPECAPRKPRGPSFGPTPSHCRLPYAGANEQAIRRPPRRWHRVAVDGGTRAGGLIGRQEHDDDDADAFQVRDHRIRAVAPGRRARAHARLSFSDRPAQALGAICARCLQPFYPEIDFGPVLVPQERQRLCTFQRQPATAGDGVRRLMLRKQGARCLPRSRSPWPSPWPASRPIRQTAPTSAPPTTTPLAR